MKSNPRPQFLVGGGSFFLVSIDEVSYCLIFMPASLIAQLITITSFGSSFNPGLFLVIFLHKEEQIYYLHIYAKKHKKSARLFFALHLYFLDVLRRLVTVCSASRLPGSVLTSFPLPYDCSSQPYVRL